MLALTKKSVANLEVYLERSVPQGLAYKWQELKGILFESQPYV